MFINRRNTLQTPNTNNLKNIRPVAQNLSGEEDRDIYTKSISKIQKEEDDEIENLIQKYQ